MIAALKNLNEQECDVLYKVPALVTVLIAGADNDIDRNEIKEAISLTHLKKVTSREILAMYYERVRERFDQQLSEVIAQFPGDTMLRQHFIVQELEKVNEILSRVDYKFAVQFYASTRDFAKKIAEASGGVLGFMSVGYEESKLVELPMLRRPEPRPASEA